MMKLLHAHDEEALFRPEFFEEVETKALGITLVQVGPVARWEEGKVELRYNVGTRGNGVDAPRWPEDLSVEVVT